MMFSVTPLYGLLLSVILLVLWMRVAAKRAANNQSIGDGGDPALLVRVRQHGNCSEWSSFILILMMLAEGMRAPAVYLHASGVLFILGRIAHPFGLKVETAAHPLRYIGNGTNILAALNLMVCLTVNLVERAR